MQADRAGWRRAPTGRPQPAGDIRRPLPTGPVKPAGPTLASRHREMRAGSSMSLSAIAVE